MRHYSPHRLCLSSTSPSNLFVLPSPRLANSPLTPCKRSLYVLGKSRNRRTFLKIENFRFLQNYDDYNHIFGIKLKGLSLSFIWRVMQWNYNVLTIKFSGKTWFLPKNAFLKLENIHTFDTHFYPLRNIVLKLFDNKCKTKACEIFTQSYQMDWYSRSCIFSCSNCVLLRRSKCNVTNGNVTNDEFLVFF